MSREHVFCSTHHVALDVIYVAIGYACTFAKFPVLAEERQTQECVIIWHVKEKRILLLVSEMPLNKG